MKWQGTIILFYFLFIFNGLCSQNLFSLTNIPDSLIEYSLAVKRFDSSEIIVLNEKEFIEKRHFAITILHNKGKDLANLNLNYDRNKSIKKLIANIYDANGILISSFKIKDFEDISNNIYYTFFSDNRAKILLASNYKIPFTIEYKYEAKHKSTISFPFWIPQNTYYLSVQNSTYKISILKNQVLNFNEVIGPFNFHKEATDKFIKYKWQLNGLKAIQKFDYAPSFLETFPHLYANLQKFYFEGTYGDYSSWNSYGKWVYDLISDKNNLSEATGQKMLDLTGNFQDDKQKVKAIYKYVQSNTRYVNIALGIGGFMPVSAADVEKFGYGDCKALVNYTKSLLSLINIKSFYAEIGSGKYNNIKYLDFPTANQTNHIILCVPLSNDTIWLECTNQNIPFGYLSNDTKNRFTLLITEDGGKLVKTPKALPSENLESISLNISVMENGSAKGKGKISFSNYIFEQNLYLFNSGKEEQIQFIKEKINSQIVEINEIKTSINIESDFKGEISFDLFMPRFLINSDDNYLINPEIFKNNYLPIKSLEDRTSNLLFENNLYKEYAVEIDLGKFKNEVEPDYLNAKSPIGYVEKRINASDSNLTIKEVFSLKDGIYSVEIFGEIESYLKQIDNLNFGLQKLTPK